VPQLIIPDRRNNERRGFGRCILSDIDDSMSGVGEGRHGLGGAGFGLPFPAKEFVRTIRRDVFEKIGKWRETLVAFAFFVEHSGAQEIQLRTVVREAIDLAVVELDGADRLVRGKSGETLCAEPTIAMTRRSMAKQCGGSFS
jgi:hypothetical protein